MVTVAATGFSGTVGSQQPPVFTDRTEAAAWVDRVFDAAAMQRIHSESANIFAENFWQEIREALSQAIPFIRDQIFNAIKTAFSKRFNALKKELIDRTVADTLGIVIPSFIRLKGVQATVELIHTYYLRESVAKSREISIPDPATQSFATIYADLRAASGESASYAAYLEELGQQRDIAVSCLANVVDSDVIFGTFAAASLEDVLKERLFALVSPELRTEFDSLAEIGRAGFLAGVLKQFEPRSA